MMKLMLCAGKHIHIYTCFHLQYSMQYKLLLVKYKFSCSTHAA
jgi:hypothetical protein